MGKTLGMVLLAILVAFMGKALFRAYWKYEATHGVAASATIESTNDKNNELHITHVNLNVDVEDFNDTLVYIDFNCSEDSGDVVRCDMTMDNIRKLCKKDKIKTSLYVQSGFKTLCGADHIYACMTLEKACALGFGDACWALAQSKYKLLLASELAYSQKACEAEHGEAEACSVLGFRYEYGEGVRRSPQKAMEYYDKACNLGNEYWCMKYKELYTKTNAH